METSLVGSYPQPEWLVDREKLRGRLPPRVRASDIWKIDPDQLADAQDAATLAAIRDQERAGLDIVTDGEIRRESYSNYFVLALDGIDVDTPGEALDRNGNPMPVPRVAGPITRRGGSILKRDAEFLRGATDRKIKVTVPGPFTMAQQAQNDHYGSEEEVAFAFADVVRAGGPRAVRGRRGHRPARRAVDGVALRAGARVRDRDPQPRAGRRHRHDRPAHLLRLPAVRPRPQAHVPLPAASWPKRPWTRSRSRRRRPSSISRSWSGSATRRSCSA